MAVKITLGQAPANFKRAVLFRTVEGDDAYITWDFKYRTRKQYGELMADDSFRAMLGLLPSENDSMEKVMDRGNRATADFILKIADGWDLESDFNRSNIEALADQYPQATSAAWEAYRDLCINGRLGN